MLYSGNIDEHFSHFICNDNKINDTRQRHSPTMADERESRSSIDSALARPTAIVVVGRGTGSRSGHARVVYRPPPPDADDDDDDDSHELVIVRTDHTFDNGPYGHDSTETSQEYFIDRVYPMSELDTAKETTKRLAQSSEDQRFGMYFVESDHATFKLYKVDKGKYTEEQELSEENGDIVYQDFAGGMLVYDPPVELNSTAIGVELRSVELAVREILFNLARTDPIRQEIQWNRYVAKIADYIAENKNLLVMEEAAIERDRATKREIDQQNLENSRV